MLCDVIREPERIRSERGSLLLSVKEWPIDTLVIYCDIMKLYVNNIDLAKLTY